MSKLGQFHLCMLAICALTIVASRIAYSIEGSQSDGRVED